MTDNEIGRERHAVQDLYRDHESLVEGAGARLMPAVRVRVRRRRTVQRVGSAAIAVAVVAVIGGVAISLSAGRTPAHAPTVTVGQPSASPTPGGTTVAPVVTPTFDELKLPKFTENALGMQIQIPEDWGGSTACPEGSQVRGVPVSGTVRLCLSPRPADNQYVYIGRTGTVPSVEIGDGASRLVGHPVRINGVPAVRAEGAIDGGQYAGWVIVASESVQMYGRAESEAVLTAILDSVKVANGTDVNGCPVIAPTSPPPPSGLATFVDPHPVTVSVCAYEGQPALLESIKHTDAAGDAPGLAGFLNHTKKGVGAHRDCAPGTYPTGIDALILVTSRNGKTRQVDLWSQPCLPRRVNNGDSDHTISITILNQIYDGIDANPGYFADPNVDKPPTFTP